ncbi:MAG: anthranilate synthase component I family protein [Gammaproteobacteria bacterium]|nr:anthranilate synthase component I family protein [Gammaproteobacteria bacterium]
MLYATTKQQFAKLSEANRRVVVTRELYGDMLTPVSVFQRLSDTKQEAVLLDSSDHAADADACIYIGLDPFAKFSVLNGKIEVSVDGNKTQQNGNPFLRLREFYNAHKCQSDHSQVKFAGGMIGYIGYDAIRYIEKVPDQHLNVDAIPEINFKLYATNVVFDKRSGKIIVAVVVDCGDDINASYQQAQSKLSEIIEKMFIDPESVKHKPTVQNPANIKVDIDDDKYTKIVKSAIEYIKQGDAFQIVPSRCFQREFKANSFDVYRAFKALNPSPYQFYIRQEDFTIVGSSPEKLVSLQNGIIETMPIAGTRPRSQDPHKDKALEQELVSDPKEIAEHMMLVDLGRNDVGAVSKAGTVEVVELAAIKRFSRVMHIVSRVQGQLRDGYDAFDVVKAVFPAGTLSGAPKIRAMEIIDGLETSRRGIYGGAICAIDHLGQLDSCIAIRTALIKNDMASVRAGGGVVLDSDPVSEAFETRHKVQAVLDALTLAEEGLR